MWSRQQQENAGAADIYVYIYIYIKAKYYIDTCTYITKMLYIYKTKILKMEKK